MHVVFSGIVLNKHARLIRVVQLIVLSANLRWLVRHRFFRLHKQGLTRVVLDVAVSVNECLSAHKARLEVNH